MPTGEVATFLEGALRRVRVRYGPPWLIPRQSMRYDFEMFEAIAKARQWKVNDVIFDVGANDGRSILRWARHLPVLPQIHAFEPVSSTFAIMAARTARLPSVHRHRLALSSETGSRPIHLHASAAKNSLDPEWGGGGATEVVALTTLDAFVAAHQINRVHFLKIDVEGHDLEVLKGARATLSRGKIDFIQIELGAGVGMQRMPSIEDAQDFLRPYGLHLYGLYNQCRGLVIMGHEFGPVLQYCDAIFSRLGAGLEQAR